MVHLGNKVLRELRRKLDSTTNNVYKKLRHRAASELKESKKEYFQEYFQE